MPPAESAPAYITALDVLEVCADLGGFARSLVHDPQLRWLGPEKGVMHMATGAVINAAWDLAAKRVGKPVWPLLGEMSPEAVGPHIRIAVDANQRWDVQVAIDWMRQLAPYDPYWIEEPTPPDDILGHAAVRKGVTCTSISSTRCAPATGTTSPRPCPDSAPRCTRSPSTTSPTPMALSGPAARHRPPLFRSNGVVSLLWKDSEER